jgi:hypothetical protein
LPTTRSITTPANKLLLHVLFLSKAGYSC